MANDDQTPTPVPAPQEGFLHSLASSLGADPETIKATVRAIIANPKQAFSEVGHEIGDEVVDAISHPKQTLKDTTTGLVQGVPSLLPNPEAAKVAQRRLQQPGLRNKLTGVRESLEAAVPMAGAGLVKGEEQSAEGNDTGALGTAVGTLAPFVIGGEAAEGGEAAKPDIFTEAGGRQVASAARVHSLVAQPEFNAKIVPAAAPDEEPAEGLEGLKFSTDPNGIKWAENKDGVRVSIPKKISSGAAADYAKTKINEQAEMQKQLRASISPKLVESAGATQVTPPEPETVPYHPDLQKIADKYGSSYSPQGSAAFIAPDGKFINLPEGVQHPNAITQATGKADRLVDNRPEFLKDTGAVRIRTTTQPYRGSLVNVSVPENMTPEQVQSIQQAVGKASQESGRNAHLTLERANVTTASKDSATTFKEHVSPRDVEPMLKQIGAHPDQRAEAVKPAAVATPEAKPDVYELNADEGEEAPAVAPEHIQSLGNEFNKTAGRPEINSTHVGDDPRTPQIAQAYEDSKHEPDNPKVQSSYAALKKDIKDQYNVLRKDGFTINAQETDPYEGTGMGPNEGPYRALREDVLNNKNITVWKGGEPPADHPMSERDPESGLTYNEMFRAIHDVFGHVAHDKNFTLNGEENAWNLHRQMFSQEALPALLTETKGQTAYVTTKGQFADQRATILPEEFHTREDDPTTGTATRTDKTPTTPTTALGNLNEWWNERAPGTKDAGTKGGLLQKKLLEPAGGVDPRTGNFDTTGKGVEILPELRQPLDHAPTAEDFQKFYEQHKELFDKNPELRVGWDNNSAEKGGHEINVGAVGEGAEKVARKLDQKSAFDIAKGENIPTGGTGLRRNFPEYSPEDRMKDLRTAPESSPTVSTRVPTKMVKGALSEDHSNQSLVSDMAAAEAAPGYVAKMVDRIKNIPGFIGSTEDAAATAKAYIRHVADNVKFVHDQITPEEFDRDSKWYPVGAHERIQEVAKRHGFTPNQIAGVTAVESPMTDWHQNTSLAERTAAIWRNQQNTKFSPEMQIAADEITSLPANKAFKAPYRQLRGKTLADLDGNIPLQAHWLRLYDEAHNPREYQTWSPDGKPAGLALNYNGQPASVGWSFQSHIEKAIRILKDGSPENISQALGYGHKVRNFYNNLIAPNDPRFLTLDTHAVNGGQLRALSSNSPDLKTHFGAIKNGPHGLKGVYPLHDAAYRLAAKELDISVPSRLQSAVWTKVQKLFSAEFKTPENVAKIDSIWKEHSDGKITADQARKRIWDFASRWDDSTDEGTQHPNDQSQLFATGVRGEAAKGTAGRGNRSGASRTVSDAVSSDEGDTSFNFGANVHKAAHSLKGLK